MNRREALILLASATLWRTVASAQEPKRLPVVGMLITHPPVTDAVVGYLRTGLREYGYDDGRTVRLEVRTALGHLDRVPALAEELVRMPVDVIVLVNEIALRAAQQLTTTIPIVTVGYIDDPVSMGWIESYRRPGGNITGIYNVNSALGAKRLEMLKELLPATSRVAALFDPAFGKRSLDALHPTARALGMELNPVALRAPASFEAGFRAAKAGRAQAVLLMWSPMFYLHRARIAELALQARLPTVTDLDSLTAAGCLLSYGSDGYYPFQRAAYFVDRLLKGARASDLPVEQVSKLKLAINLKTATALGIEIPQSILLRADEIIQ